MFNKILIANRGEIACRIIKTAHRMGIETVAVYSTADRCSLHTTLADHAFCIGDPAASASYLNSQVIIATAIESGAEAIHPGYGFLSENAHFAEACAKAGLVFIGPSVAAMQAMASKQLAKQLLEKTSVPLTPGYHGNDQSDDRLLSEAKRIGFPVLLKAASGGGGKGMRTVSKASEFVQSLASARREATASFGDDTMLIEKLIQNTRHVEIQIMADHHDQVVHLFERDCSIQRRHQKIIEEAPAPHLPASMRQGLADAAIAVARAIEYHGAGTVEFLVTGETEFYFMEMNTRLQVEHPVTELITGLDLVEWQLRIAANEPLPCSQADIQARGHAIECRIYAEDPYHDFIPSIGTLHFLKEPSLEGIRLDSGVKGDSQITRFYDPMIAKLIAWGENRQEALQRLLQALKHYHIGGVKTNIPFLQAILTHPHFNSATLSTDFLSQHTLDLPCPDKQWAVFMAASVDYLQALNQHSLDPLRADTFSWQMHLKSHWRSSYKVLGEQQDILIAPISPHEIALTLNNRTVTWRITLEASQLIIEDGQQRRAVWVENTIDAINFYTENGPITIQRINEQHLTDKSQETDAPLTAPMPATVVAILKKKGDKIKAGDRLIVLEAMKMEHTILAPEDGLLVDIFFEVGAQVNEGAELVSIDKEKGQP